MSFSAQKEAEIVQYLKDQAIPLASLDPDHRDHDLQPLRKIVGEARLVGLGEATHGNKEPALVRHRVIRFLVEQMGFDGLVMEIEQQSAQAMDRYVKTGDGDPNKILAEIGYGFVFNTQEVFDLIEWMRKYNQEEHGKQLTFKGCDIKQIGEETLNERDQKMAENTLRFLDEVGENSRLALWAHNYHVASRNSYRIRPKTGDPKERIYWKPQGEYLRHHLGDSYLNFATFFNRGKVNGVKGDFEKKIYEYDNIIQARIPSAEFGSYEYFFAQTKLPAAFFDLRPIKNLAAFTLWQTDHFTERMLGFAIDPNSNKPIEEDVQTIAGRYDGVIWIDKVSPSTVLPFEQTNL